MKSLINTPVILDVVLVSPCSVHGAILYKSLMIKSILNPILHSNSVLVWFCMSYKVVVICSKFVLATIQQQSYEFSLNMALTDRESDS